MANLLQSSQTQSTQAPGFYTDYLSNLASQGQQAAKQAQYVGAQPLQQQAFTDVAKQSGAFQPYVTQAQQTLTGAAGMSPLEAGAQYLKQATQSPAALAQQYMNPYVQSAVQGMSDIAQRNLQQNLAPQATAATVGSGQFGSQRGAQVLGQVERQAQQDLNAQIAQMMTQGYGQALTAAGQQNALLGTLGATAGQQAGLGQQNLTNIGQQLGTLGQTGQNISLADINALATLGGQQQTIAQNQQLFPLTNLSTLSGMLRGYNIPTTTVTQASASPLSVLASGTAGLAGAFQPMYDASGKIITDASGNPVTVVSQFKTGLQNMWNTVTGALPNYTGGGTQLPPNTIPGQQDMSAYIDENGDLITGSD